MSTAVSGGPHISIAALLLTLASDASAQQRAPLLHPAPDPRTATSQKMVAPRNSLEALDRHFAQLDRRRLVVKPGPRVINPQAARLNPNPQLMRTLEAHGRTLRAAPAAAPKHLPGRQTSAALRGDSCAAAKRDGVNIDHLVLGWRPNDDGGILRPGITYEAYGCGLGKTTASTALTIPFWADVDSPLASARIHAWSDSRVAFTLNEVPNTYDFLIVGLTTRDPRIPSTVGIDARFAGMYYATRVSKAFAAIPQKAVTVSTSTAGAPAISVPMDFYGLKGAVGVARQSPGGLLSGQDSIEIRLARDVVLESVQVQYLAYDASGAPSVSTGPANIGIAQQETYYHGPRVARITVNWPVGSVALQGQPQPVSYSVYALSITLKGPKGMPAFDGIPSIVLN